MLRRLSFPPDASCCWSKDHFNPHTSCLWPTILLMQSQGTLISRTRIFLSLDPLAKMLLVFHEIAPTLAVWPLQVKIFLCFMQSQSCTQPVCVPTPKTLEVGLDDVLVTRSLEDSSTSLTTLEFPAFQRQTLLLSPTASKLVDDQSTRLRQKSSQSAGASSTLVGILLIFLSFGFFTLRCQSGNCSNPLENRLRGSFSERFQSLQLYNCLVYLYLRKFQLEKVQMSLSLKRLPSPSTSILQTSFTVMPLFYVLLLIYESFSSSSIHSRWSLKRSLAEHGIFLTGKKRSPMYFIDLSFLSSRWVKDDPWCEQMFLLERVFGFYSMLQDDFGKVSYSMSISLPMLFSSVIVGKYGRIWYKQYENQKSNVYREMGKRDGGK